MSALQEFINTEPGLAILAVLIIGVALVLAVRIVLASFGCLLRLVLVAVVVIALVVLLQRLLAH